MTTYGSSKPESNTEYRQLENVGTVESLWRYPVKSMRGEEVGQAFLGFAGVYGDRCYAIRDSAALDGFPFLTGREQERMLLYRPKFRHPQQAALPPNLAQAEALGPGLTPVFGNLSLDVETPDGRTLAIDDPTLIAELTASLDENHELSISRSDRAITDCRPISIFSLRTAQRIGEEAGLTLDKRRFRANVFANLELDGFAENAFVGRKVQIGKQAVIAIIATDPRCKMITLDPDTAEARPEVLRAVARNHDGNAGLYGAVLVEGVVQAGDAIVVLD